MNSPLVVAVAGLPVLVAIALIYLFIDGGERIDAARAELDEPADAWPAADYDGETPLRPDLEAHIRQALDVADPHWDGVDELQYRRELRKHNNPTNN